MKITADNAPKTITLTAHVSTRDIAKGCRADAENCPIARALLRALHDRYPDADIDLGVSQGGASFGFVYERHQGNPYYYDGQPKAASWYNADPPPEMTTFIDRFDTGNPVEPASFQLHFRFVGGSSDE